MGWFNKKKDNDSEEIRLLGIQGQIATMKCLLMASIKGVPLKTTLVPFDGHINQIDSYQSLATGEKTPTLTQGDYSVSGARAIMTYLDTRGKGMSLIPKKARILGLQNYWIDVCYQTLGSVTQSTICESATDDDSIRLKEILTSLNMILDENTHIVGQLSFAEPNVAAYIYLLHSSGYEMSIYPNINKWLSRLEQDISTPLNIAGLELASEKMMNASQVSSSLNN